MKLTFEDFWNRLVENDIWYEIVRMRFHKKDVKKCAGDAFVYLLADGKLIETNDVIAWRKYLTSWLIKAPDAPVAPQLQQVEEPKVVRPEDKPIPKDDPRYDAYLKLWQSEVDKFAVDHVVPRVSKKEAIEQGDWLPPKPAPYKSDDDVFMIHLKENVRRFAARKYKGFYSWSGFKNFDIGLIQVYAQNASDAQEFVTKAERYTRMKLKD